MLPKLIIVSGPPGGFGKSTLAHEIARRIGFPAILRDEIKQGMVLVNPGFQPGPGDHLTRKATPLFFEVIALLIRGGASVVAEAAFRDRVWRPNLEPIVEHADLRVIRCTTENDIAHARGIRRHETNAIHRAAHAAPKIWAEEFGRFEEISLPAPRLLVDTTNGYAPGLEDILAFVNDGDRQRADVTS